MERQLAQPMFMMPQLHGSSPNLCKEREQLMLLMLGLAGPITIDRGNSSRT